jgi:hypothetical protein
MPFDFQYNPDNEFLVVTLQGKFPPEEFEEAMQRITHSGDFPPDVSILWDGRGVQMPTAAAWYEIALLDIRRRYPERGTSKLAILVTGNLAFGMSRMYETLSGSLPQHIRVFRDYDKAVEWLLAVNK